MWLKSINLNNWKQFEGQHRFEFDKINFVAGNNGIGKSNLTINAILFGLYGYSDKLKLSDLITYGKKSAVVSLEIEKNNSHYTIERQIPSKVKILKNHAEIEWKENGVKERDLYIQELFGSLTYFKKFRIVDGYDKEVNFLEQGNTTLKKILFSFTQNQLNEAKNFLLEMKNEIQSNMKKEGQIKHFYSEKRLNILKEGIRFIEEKILELQRERKKIQGTISTISHKQGVLLAQIKEANKQIKKAEQKICYACKQPIPVEKRKKIKKEALEVLKKAKKEYKLLDEDREEFEILLEDYTNQINYLTNKKVKLNELIAKLKMVSELNKQFKYTKQDYENIKKALNLYEQFMSEYLVYSIKTLEPIINSVLDKIGFKVSFEVSNSKFNLVLSDNKNRKWSYHQLSTGQKLLLQIAIKVALLMKNNETGLIIADEGLGSLDEENLLYIIDLFENLPFQLIMVLHHFKNLPDYVNVLDLNQYFGV